jgi:hypothetical protein
MSNLTATTPVNMDRHSSINKDRRARLERARTATEQFHLSLWSSELRAGRWSFEELSKELAVRPGLDLLAMDGYGLAPNEEPSAGATSATLQRLAHERNIAVLVTACLETRQDPRDRSPRAHGPGPAGQDRGGSRDGRAPPPPRPRRHRPAAAR